MKNSSFKTLLLLALLATVSSLSAQSYVTTFAGNGTNGYVNGNRTNCEMGGSVASCFDTAGNLYFFDNGNTVVRKIDTNGNVTTVAGNGSWGSDDGQGTNASFKMASGIAVDASTNLYVADTGNYVIRKITPSGLVSTLSAPGGGSPYSFNQPIAVVVDGATNLYVATMGDHKIWKIHPGFQPFVLAGNGNAGDIDASTASATFNYPDGLALDASTNIYVSELFGQVIRKVTPAGVVSTLAGKAGTSGYVDATGTNARFYYPKGMAVDAKTNIYVADSYNNAIRKITAAGVVTTLAGSNATAYNGTIFGAQGYVDGLGSSAEFNQPYAVSLDKSNNLYVSDYSNLVIRYVQIPTKTQTIAKFGKIPTATYGASYELPIPAASSKLPVSISVLSTNYAANLSGTNFLSYQGLGTVTIAATQSGDGTYLPAPQVTTSFVVNPATNVISNFNFSGLKTVSVGQTFRLNPSCTSRDSVMISVVSGPATVSYNSVTFTGKGTVALKAVVSGVYGYLDATNKLSITVK
jgi:sugar lactone lactonase YvrE